MVLSETVATNVMTALRAGNKIEAIKALRAATGLGLAQAKVLADALEQGDVDVANGMLDAAKPDSLPQHDPNSMLNQIVQQIGHNNKIGAIKLLREHANVGLKEAKEAVDAFTVGRPEQLLAMLGHSVEPAAAGFPRVAQSGSLEAQPVQPIFRVTEEGGDSAAWLPKWALPLLFGLVLGAALVWLLR